MKVSGKCVHPSHLFFTGLKKRCPSFIMTSGDKISVTYYDILKKVLKSYPDFKKPSFWPTGLNLTASSKFIEISCGKCLNCKLKKSRDWATRCQYEMDRFPEGSSLFLTLTYDDDNLPTRKVKRQTLVKPVKSWFSSVPVLNFRDIQLFNKRLREAIGPFRFFLCGEYGPTTFRPHYHGVYFGLKMSDFPDAKIWRDTSHGHSSITYVSEKLNKIWKLGRVNFSLASFETCAYISRYICKPGKDFALKCEAEKIVPSKLLMSRRPGIGMFKIEDEKAIKQVNETGTLLYHRKGKVYRFALPPSMKAHAEKIFGEDALKKNPYRLIAVTDDSSYSSRHSDLVEVRTSQENENLKSARDVEKDFSENSKKLLRFDLK